MKKLPAGIREVGPGHWEVRARVKSKRTGHQCNAKRRVHGTLREAEEARRSLVAELREDIGTEVDATLTLADFAASWIASRAARGMRPSSLRARAKEFDRVIVPALGDYYIKALRRRDVDPWVETLARTYAPKTVNGLLGVLKTLVRDAYERFEWGPSPIERVRGVRDSGRAESDPNSLDVEDLVSFLQAFRSRYPQGFALTYMAFTTGLRFSELAGLEWRDVDFEKGMLVVQRAFVSGHIQPPKTRRSRRSVALVREQIRVLEEHRQRLLATQNPGFAKGYVFPSTRGERAKHSTLARQFKTICEELKLSFRVTPHGARRTFNNLLRRRGVDRQVLRSLTGHTAERMTGHYSTVSKDEQKRAVGEVVKLVAQKMAH